MNKRFFKVAFLCLVACSVSASFTSCKDYDEDINSLRQETSGLGGQLSALEEALNSTKTELTNAQKAADDAMAQAKAAADAAKAAQSTGDAAKAAAEAANAEALAAKALAEEAKAAAAKAKEEAIAEAIAQCKELMASTVSQDEFNQKISELNGKIEGIQTGLSILEKTVADINKQVSDLAKWQSTVDTQLKALENLQSEVESMKSDIDSVVSDLEALTGTVGGLSDDLNALKATVDGMNETIDGLKELIDGKATPADIDAAINELDTEIRKYVDGKFDAINVTLDSLQDQLDALQSNINTVKDVLTFRLTSLSLIPSEYQGGIPTMSFFTLHYYEKQYNKTKHEWEVIQGKDPIIVDNEKTFVEYWVNPSKITKDYLKSVQFVTSTATTRAGSLIETTGDFEITDSKLRVYAKKTSTGSLDPTNPNTINIFALKAVLADKSLTEDEIKNGTDIAVYSEYAKFTEQVFTPFIAKRNQETGITDPSNTYYSYSEVYGAGEGANIATDVVYNEVFDLNDIVGVAYGVNSTMDLDYLKSFGVTFRYAAQDLDSYELGASKTDQQKFVTTDMYGHVQAKTLTGEGDKKSAIGKEPIVRVQMVDTLRGNKNRVLDERYFKIRFVAEKLVDKNIEYNYVKPIVLTGCSTDYSTSEFTWDVMTKVVLEQLGMSFDEFSKVYTNNTWNGSGKVTVDFDEISAGSAPLVWTLSNDDIKEIPQSNPSKVFTGKLTFSDPNGLNPNIILTLKVTVRVDVPAFAGYVASLWTNNNTVYELAPVRYDGQGARQVKYSNNLLSGFNLIDNTYLLTTFKENPCRVWEMQFSNANQPEGYAPASKTPALNNSGYSLKKGGSAAATLAYAAGHTVWGAGNMTDVTFNLTKNAVGKELVGKRVNVTVWAKINEYNTYQIGSYYISILEPFKFTMTDPKDAFVDAQSSGSTVNVEGAYKVEEVKGGVVEIGKPIASYYGLSVRWDVANTKIGMKEEGGNVVVDDNLTGESANALKLSEALTDASVVYKSGNLVFTHKGGDLIHQSCNVFVPVVFTHEWGTHTEYVTIRLNPAE